MHIGTDLVTTSIAIWQLCVKMQRISRRSGRSEVIPVVKQLHVCARSQHVSGAL